MYQDMLIDSTLKKATYCDKIPGDKKHFETRAVVDEKPSMAPCFKQDPRAARFAAFCDVKREYYVVESEEQAFNITARQAANILSNPEFFDKANPLHMKALIVLDEFLKQKPTLVQEATPPKRRGRPSTGRSMAE